LIGYGLGHWIASGDRRLRMVGVFLLALFFALRLGFAYGDPNPFHSANATLTTLMAVLNVTKHPLSLQFICITLGPTLIFLGSSLQPFHRSEWIQTLGRVPMFFYILHLWALHAVAIAGALAGGYAWSSVNVVRHFGGRPPGFGFPLWMTLPFAAVTIALVYPTCRWYDEQRRQNRWAWTSYV
jgi:hypothetical protein